MPETLGDVGEFGLIDRIAALLESEGNFADGVTLGIGDDAASFRPKQGYDLLVTCDCAVEGRHFLPQYITAMDLGRRCMTLNISDIGAMGGHPRYALVSLGLRDECTRCKTGNAGPPNCAHSKEEAIDWWADLTELYPEVNYYPGCCGKKDYFRPTNRSLMNNAAQSSVYGPVNERFLRNTLTP